ncbi:MAG: TIGR02221 family CRISPR-associated protein [Deltaproteobacteria bacterium]|nr:TIGR02221 family CRISPR-associated protein [Deltaproteobacteria bacterium]
MAAEQCFITSIGVGNYDDVLYALGSATWRSRFAPVAIARLLGLAGARALVLVTQEARAKWYEQVVAELASTGTKPESVDIPNGRNEEEILAIFSTLQQRIPDNARVVLDVTFALRHLPFVYFASLAYLVGLRGVQVGGIYYGAYDLSAEGRVPILEVTALFQLLQWYHALASVRDAGDWTLVATRLRQDVGRLFRRGLGDRELSRLQEPAKRLADALAMGLPIEAGLRAADLREGLAGLAEPGGALTARLALAALNEQLPNWAVEGKPRKNELRLTADELSRELRVAEWYVQHREHEKALAIMREGLVSALMLRGNAAERWLDYGHRKPFEDRLNAYSERAKATVASDSEKTLASLWDALAKKRNQFAHAGMTEGEVTVSDAEVTALLERCRALLAGTLLGEVQCVRGHRLLLTPVGLSPGVLYSGALHVKPDRFLIVASREAAPRIPEALANAAAGKWPYQVLCLQEPHLGYREIDQHVGKELDRLFATAAEVIVNVTGGTTVMQYAVERLAARARRLGAAVRRCALIDRRSPEEQRANPYVLGEIVWLDNDDKEASPSSSPAGDAGEES